MLLLWYHGALCSSVPCLLIGPLQSCHSGTVLGVISKFVYFPSKLFRQLAFCAVESHWKVLGGNAFALQRHTSRPLQGVGRLSYAKWNALLQVCGQFGVICTATAVLPPGSLLPPLLIFNSSPSTHSNPLWPKWTLNLQWKWKTPSQSFLKWRKPKRAKLATLSNRKSDSSSCGRVALNPSCVHHVL